jgi:hypothetical protein
MEWLDERSIRLGREGIRPFLIRPGRRRCCPGESNAMAGSWGNPPRATTELLTLRRPGRGQSVVHPRPGFLASLSRFVSALGAQGAKPGRLKIASEPPLAMDAGTVAFRSMDRVSSSGARSRGSTAMPNIDSTVRLPMSGRFNTPFELSIAPQTNRDGYVEDWLRASPAGSS